MSGPTDYDGDGDGACCGCHALRSSASVAPLPSGLFICFPCATKAQWDIISEGGRQIAYALLEADLTAPLRSMAP